MSCSSTRQRAVAAVVVDLVPLARASFLTQCSVDDTCLNDVPADSRGQDLLGRDALRHVAEKNKFEVGDKENAAQDVLDQWNKNRAGVKHKF